jgi:hypothetical protein
MFYLTSICIRFLHFLSTCEKKWRFKFSWLKICIIRNLMHYDKHFIDNEITNIVCTKPNVANNFQRVFAKIDQHASDIFRISPRSLVFCVLHKNEPMLKHIQQLGYPLEMISYADNFNLIKKYSRKHCISLSIVKV